MRLIRALKDRIGIRGLVTDLLPESYNARDWRTVADDVARFEAKQSEEWRRDVFAKMFFCWIRNEMT